jgi:hypothetical protein
LPDEPGTPGKPIFAKQNRKRPSHRRPIPTVRTFKESQLATHGIPRGRDANNELRAIVWNAIGVRASRKEHQQADQQIAQHLEQTIRRPFR